MSKLIKSSAYTTTKSFIRVEPRQVHIRKSSVDLDLRHNQKEQDSVDPSEWNEALSIKEQMIKDAESTAAEIVEQAMKQAEQLKEAALQEIETWWTDKRAEDQMALEEAHQLGFHEGTAEGFKNGEQQALDQYQQTVQEAETVLRQAYRLKQQIISEAEPFLVELSSAIARKIIDRELSTDAEWTKQLAQRTLSRRRVKGVITLCVAPASFAYMQDMREELLLHVDSQAELQIVPDATVRDQGCVVRTDVGSIDARIDMQLKEVKDILYQIALNVEEVAADGQVAPRHG